MNPELFVASRYSSYLSFFSSIDVVPQAFQVKPGEGGELHCQLLSQALEFGGQFDYFERYSQLELQTNSTAKTEEAISSGKNKTVHWSKLNIDFNSSSCLTLHTLRKDINDKVIACACAFLTVFVPFSLCLCLHLVCLYLLFACASVCAALVSLTADDLHHDDHHR